MPQMNDLSFHLKKRKLANEKLGTQGQKMEGNNKNTCRHQ